MAERAFDPSIFALRHIFDGVFSEDTLADTLAQFDGNVNAAVEALLEMNESKPSSSTFGRQIREKPCFPPRGAHPQMPIVIDLGDSSEEEEGEAAEAREMTRPATAQRGLLDLRGAAAGPLDIRLAMLTRVKEISIHESHTFEVIMRKNGRKQTITPAMLKGMADAQKSRMEQQRTAALAGQYNSRHAGLYACPFKISRCNGRSQACARCKQRLMNGDLVIPPKRGSWTS